jgi:hypothetical protein
MIRSKMMKNSTTAIAMPALPPVDSPPCCDAGPAGVVETEVPDVADPATVVVRATAGVLTPGVVTDGCPVIRTLGVYSETDKVVVGIKEACVKEGISIRFSKAALLPIVVFTMRKKGL